MFFTCLIDLIEISVSQGKLKLYVNWKEKNLYLWYKIIANRIALILLSFYTRISNGKTIKITRTEKLLDVKNV